MNCKETQNNISLFVQEKLNMEQLELFLEHIENCSVCREELEVYYTLHTAMQILEENLEYEHTNYQIDLKWELEKSKDKLRKTKRNRIEKHVLFVIIAIVIGIFIL